MERERKSRRERAQTGARLSDGLETCLLLAVSLTFLFLTDSKILER